MRSCTIPSHKLSRELRSLKVMNSLARVLNSDADSRLIAENLNWKNFYCVSSTLVAGSHWGACSFATQCPENFWHKPLPPCRPLSGSGWHFIAAEQIASGLFSMYIIRFRKSERAFCNTETLLASCCTLSCNSFSQLQGAYVRHASWLNEAGHQVGLPLKEKFVQLLTVDWVACPALKRLKASMWPPAKRISKRKSHCHRLSYTLHAGKFFCSLLCWCLLQTLDAQPLSNLHTFTSLAYHMTTHGLVHCGESNAHLLSCIQLFWGVHSRNGPDCDWVREAKEERPCRKLQCNQ